MTPTLFGRWQTRLLLLGTVGVLVTIPFAMGLIGSGKSSVYFAVIFYVALFGIAWDVLYNHLQKYRWDRDWPAAYQAMAGIWEMIFIWCGLKIFSILPIPIPRTSLLWRDFFMHYVTVWLAVFIASQTMMRVIFPRWRFHGGEWFNR
ncbi:hypothetical protein [Calothrix sp. 336/3]|uniref:hypothetical protein n=1 Tax=Calothrix sp. 336/3 TaxID=1337936 RepID=UPI0004E36BAC|nr:hypothetical protein [Calothrix sp. 336/3]AKG20555.1 hypothetical protein IJ00_03785 [Calothrix sp. 336/3]